MTKRAIAAASDPVAAAAANDLLARGNAVDAVVAGVLAAAGAHAGVLLGPVQVLIGGAGIGLRAVDGRVRQPGRGAPRPRGFLPEEEVPPPAYVGVPGLPAALAAALASFGKSTAAQVHAAGIEHAKQKMPERARVLDALARRGPAALAAAPLADEIVAACGRLSGGLVTLEDIGENRPSTGPCATTDLGELRVATVPWGAHAVRDAAVEAMSAGATRVVAAADMRGAFAIACYEVAEEGVAIPSLGLVAPLAAEPVRRGTARVRPGEPRPAAAPVALTERAEGVDLALGLAEAADGEAALRELVRALSTGVPVEVAAASVGRGRVTGVLRTPGGAVQAVGQAS